MPALRIFRTPIILFQAEPDMTTRKRKTVAKPEPGAAKVEEIVIGTTSKLHFPIVGIGASAGGLAAFEAFFVTIQHNLFFVL